MSRPGPTVLLIPGAGGEAWYWHLLVPELERRGHHGIAVELPAGDESAGLPEYTDAVVAAAVAGDPRETDDGYAVVAQSMGGFTAPLVCRRLPVRLLVLVNAMIPAPGETPGQWWDATGQRAARRDNDIRAGRDPDAEFDPAVWFFHDVPDAVTRVAFAGDPPVQADAVFESRADFESWPAVPTRVLTGQDDRIFPADFQRRVSQQRLGITPEIIPGGHLLALADPVGLADRLHSYLRSG